MRVADILLLICASRNLPKLDYTSECDPLVTLSAMDAKTNKFEYLDRTEMIMFAPELSLSLTRSLTQ